MQLYGGFMDFKLPDLANGLVHNDSAEDLWKELDDRFHGGDGALVYQMK